MKKYTQSLQNNEELLHFQCRQNIVYLLGDCDCECTTRLLYEGSGCTTNPVIVVGGNASIESSGTGALVLTKAILSPGTCSRTLTLTGTNEEYNGVVAMSNPSIPNKLSVTKDGPGLWMLTATSTYTGQTLIKNGTLIAAVGAVNVGNGVFGSSNSPIPIIGDTTAGAEGVAALLLRSGVTISRNLAVAASSGSQVVRLGGVHTDGTSVFQVNREIRLGSDRAIELVAKGTGVVRFRNFWLDSDGGANVGNNFEVGTPDFGGVVRIESDLATSGSVLVVNGRLEINPDGSLEASAGLTCETGTELRIIVGSGPDRIDPSTEVLLRGAVLDIGGSSQRIEDLTLEQSATVSDTVGGGLLRLDGSVDALEPGNVISSDVELVSVTTFDVDGSLEISGVVSGSNIGIVKDGGGNLILSGENSYEGNTTVLKGTVTVNGALASGTLTVATNAMLMGSGTINGATTIFGTHSPGNSVGVETFTNNLSYSGGSSTIIWELWNNTTSNSLIISYDQVVVSGNLDFAQLTSLSLNFGGLNVGAVNWTDSFWNTNRSWKIFDVAGDIFNFNNLTLISNPENWLDSNGVAFSVSARSGGSFSIAQQDSDIFIIYTVAGPS